MGGSFNTREFFHGATPRKLRAIKWAFLLLAFAAAGGAAGRRAGQGAPCWRSPSCSSTLGLLAERWYFFAAGEPSAEPLLPGDIVATTPRRRTRRSRRRRSHVRAALRACARRACGAGRSTREGVAEKWTGQPSAWSGPPRGWRGLTTMPRASVCGCVERFADRLDRPGRNARRIEGRQSTRPSSFRRGPRSSPPPARRGSPCAACWSRSADRRAIPAGRARRRCAPSSPGSRRRC